jgi:energy-coupling factor transport system ATP-binding protein
MQIVLNNVTFAYKKNSEILHNISLRIDEGECIGVMGKTGSGKTTFLELIAGLLDPTNGTITTPTDDIGFVFQNPEQQLFASTVREDVSFGLKFSGLSKQEKEVRVEEALTLMGLEPAQFAEEMPLALSGGEQRRVAIAGVLALKKKVLLFDEPFSGLDESGVYALLKVLWVLRKEGITIIIVSHNEDALAMVTKRILIVEDGRIAKDAPVSEVFSDVDDMVNRGLGVCTYRLITYKLGLPETIVTYGDLLNALKEKLATKSTITKRSTK